MADQKKKKRRKKETQEQKLRRILIALAIFAVVFAMDEFGALKAAFGDTGCVYASFALYLVPFIIAGHDVLQEGLQQHPSRQGL